MRASSPGRIAWSMGLALGLAGCSPSPASPASGAPFPLYPMALVFAGPREQGEPVGILQADGSIVTRREGTIARLLPDRIVMADGRPKIVVSPNGDVSVGPGAPVMHFDARGALVSSSGDEVWVDDSGVPSMKEGRGREGLPPLPVRFTPFTPEARRTAEALFLVLLEVAWSRPMS